MNLPLSEIMGAIGLRRVPDTVHVLLDKQELSLGPRQGLGAQDGHGQGPY